MISIGSTITWSDGQQTVIRNQAEIDMIQWCLWDVVEIDGKPPGSNLQAVLI